MQGILNVKINLDLKNRIVYICRGFKNAQEVKQMKSAVNSAFHNNDKVGLGNLLKRLKGGDFISIK